MFNETMLIFTFKALALVHVTILATGKKWAGNTSKENGLITLNIPKLMTVLWVVFAWDLVYRVASRLLIQ